MQGDPAENGEDVPLVRGWDSSMAWLELGWVGADGVQLDLDIADLEVPCELDASMEFSYDAGASWRMRDSRRITWQGRQTFIARSERVAQCRLVLRVVGTAGRCYLGKARRWPPRKSSGGEPAG